MTAGSRLIVTLYLVGSRPITIEPNSAIFKNQSALKVGPTPHVKQGPLPARGPIGAKEPLTGASGVPRPSAGSGIPFTASSIPDIGGFERALGCAIVICVPFLRSHCAQGAPATACAPTTTLETACPWELPQQQVVRRHRCSRRRICHESNPPAGEPGRRYHISDCNVGLAFLRRGGK
jgi:hypothetical protein